jgi:flagellar hook-associated protein FlgK
MRNRFLYYKIFIVILALGIISCKKQERHKGYHFYGYYDDQHKKLHQTGWVNEFEREDGSWEIFSEEGKLIQSGTYENGLPIGKWNYNLLNYLTDSLTWQKFESTDIEVSLPSSYHLLDQTSDGNLQLIFRDSITNSLLSISKYLKKEIDINGYSMINESEMLRTFDIDFYKLETVTTSDQIYFIEQYNFYDNQHEIDLVQHFILIETDTNLFVLNHTGEQKDSLKLKFILGEIFYHLFYNDSRLFNPLTNKNQKVITRDLYRR